MQAVTRNTQSFANTCRQLSVGLQPEPGKNYTSIRRHPPQDWPDPGTNRRSGIEDAATHVKHAGCGKNHSILCQHMQATVNMQAETGQKRYLHPHNTNTTNDTAAPLHPPQAI
jgi:hypothetical protein